MLENGKVEIKKANTVLGKERNKIEFCFIFILGVLFLISTWRLITSNSLISYWDWPGLPKSYYDIKSVWNSTNLGFRVSLPSYYLIFSWPFLRLLDSQWVSNLWVVIPLLIAIISSYLVARRITGSPIASFVSSIVYSFNPVFLTRYLQAHIGILVGYALFPFLLLSALILFDKKQLFSRRVIRFFVLAILISFIFALQVHFLLLAFLLLLIYIVFHTIMVRSALSLLKNLAVVLGIFALVVVLVLPLTLNVLVFSRFNIAPSLISTEHVYSLSQETYFYNLFRLIGESGPGFLSDIGYYGNSFWTLLGFLVPILALAIFLFWRSSYPMSNIQRPMSTESRQLIIFLSVLALLGIFLATGTTYFPKLYLWFYLNVPFFYAFRESSKFLILVSLAYALLVGIAVKRIGLRIKHSGLSGKDKIKDSGSSRKLLASSCKLTAIGTLIACQLIFSWPMLTGDFMIQKLHSEYEISEDLDNLGEWLDTQKEFFRVMVLPYDDFMFHIWRHISSKPVVSLDMGSSRASAGAYQYSIFAHDTLYQGKVADLAKLLALTSTKYVIIRENVVKTKSFYTSERFDFSFPKVKKILNSSENFEEVQNFGDYTVYENKDFKEHIFGVEKPVLAIGNRELLLSSSQVTGLDDVSSALVFASQLSDIKDLEMFDTMIINSDLKDLQFILLDDEYKLSAYDYAKNITTGENPKELVQFLWLQSDIYEYVTGGIFGNGAMPYGNGYAVTEGQAQLVLPYTCANSGEYEIWLRVLYAPNRGKMTISIDGNTVVDNFSPELSYFTGFKWTRLKESVELTEGKHTVSITNLGSQNAIDQIALMPKSIMPSLEDRVKKTIINKRLIYLDGAERVIEGEIAERSSNSQNPVSLTFKQINSTKYVIQYESSKPFLMILNESYHPLWRAYVGGEEIESIPTNSYANGFYIKTPLEGKVVIEFVEQRYINMAFWISGGVFCGIVGLIVFLRLRRRYCVSHRNDRGIGR